MFEIAKNGDCVKGMKQPTVLCVFQKLLLNLILKCSSKHARCGESKCTSFFTICYFDNNLSIYFHTVLPFPGHNLHQTSPVAYSSITGSSRSAAGRLSVPSLEETLGCSENKQSRQNYASAVVDPIKSKHEKEVFFKLKLF